jgi:signal transduction histidine kinase
MTFRIRMALVFTLLVGVLLVLFALFFYSHSESLRSAEFYDRLEDRALLVEHLFEEARSMPVDEAQHLAQALREALPNEAISVISIDGKVIFQRAASGVVLPSSWKELATRNGIARVTQGERQFVIIDTPDALKNGIRYTMASAVDVRGLRSMATLRRSLMLAAVLALLFTAVLSWAYTTWALVPVRDLVRRAGEIHAPSERLPVNDERKPDELGAVAIAFNALLARLDDAFQVQRSFVATASHELRTPLTVVRGQLHQAMGLARDQVDMMDRLHGIEEQTLHMQDLLDQLLWLAQSQEAGEHRLQDQVRVDEVAERALQRCRVRYPEVQVRFELSLEDEDREPLVRGSSVLLTAAVYNLLANAAKYGGGHPITLAIRSTAEGTSVQVRDEGPGMDETTLFRARELFFRGQDAVPMDGHGIGLALVERIARVHGGRVSIVSRSGGGTTVELVLPAVA